MNFDMAGDLVEFDDITCSTVVLADDVASAPPEEREKRRGVAGMVYAFKIAGAAAEEGRDLDAVTSVAQKAADACRSVGVALSPCTVPQAGKPTFEINTASAMFLSRSSRRLLATTTIEEADIAIAATSGVTNPTMAGDHVSIMVNSLGATPPEELYILYRIVKQRLDAAGATIVMPLVGRYATSMEMSGVSFTLCKLDDELETLLKAPCDCEFWRVG